MSFQLTCFSEPSTGSISITIKDKDRCFFRYTLHLFSLLLSHTKFISSSMQTTRNLTWICRLAAIHMIFLHVSLVWTLFTFGFVKMAWPSTLLNQFCHFLWHITETQISVWSQVCQYRWDSHSSF